MVNSKLYERVWKGEQIKIRRKIEKNGKILNSEISIVNITCKYSKHSSEKQRLSKWMNQQCSLWKTLLMQRQAENKWMEKDLTSC